MKKRNATRLAALILALLLTVGGITAFASAGGANDPLVTLSYLNETFLATVTEKVKTLIGQRDEQLKSELSQQIAVAEKELRQEYGSGTGSGAAGTYDSATFVVVTLEKGQTLTGAVGCELMLRSGSAVCVASSAPGLIDSTSGKTLSSGGALEQNHLYMATIEGRGAKATAGSTRLLVRGAYTIG